MNVFIKKNIAYKTNWNIRSATKWTNMFYTTVRLWRLRIKVTSNGQCEESLPITMTVTLENNPDSGRPRRYRYPWICLDLQEKEGIFYRSNLQIQGRPEYSRGSTNIRRQLLRNLLTGGVMDHLQNSVTTHNSSPLALTSNRLRSCLPTSWYRYPPVYENAAWHQSQWQREEIICLKVRK